MFETNPGERSGHLKVVDAGSGPTVVLIHGWPVTDFHWRYLIPQLEKNGYRTLTVTPRGLGDGSVPDSSAKFRIAAEISDELSRHSVDQYCIVGHDWGGTLGYLLADSDRTNCRGLVIEEEILPGINVDIPKPGSEHYPSWHGPFNRSIGLGESLIPGNEDTYYGTFLRESAGPKPLEESATSTYLSAYASKNQLQSTLAYYRTQRIDRESIVSISADPIGIPILCIGGQYGMGSAVSAGMRSIENNIFEAIIEGAGHYPAEQAPLIFAHHVLIFLQGVYQERG